MIGRMRKTHYFNGNKILNQAQKYIQGKKWLMENLEKQIRIFSNRNKNLKFDIKEPRELVH